MIINNVVYREGERVRDISLDETSDWLGRADSFVWLALRDPTPAELARLEPEFGLHELAVEDASHGHQRPKIEDYGGSLFVVMHLLELRPGGELHVGEVAVFVGHDFVVSIRSRSDMDLLGVRARAEREPQLLKHGSAFVLYALMDAVVDRYFPVIEALETELDEIEHHIFNRGAARANLERLYGLKQKTTVLRHAVLPLHEAVAKLIGGRVPAVCGKSQPYFRDVYDHLARINANIDAMRDTINTAIQVNLALVAVDQSEVAKRLAAWAAIFGVVTALVGIWGMNFAEMPETKWEYGYPLALGVIALATAVLYLRFKRIRWL